MEEQLRPIFDEFDTSGDGRISKAEMSKAIGKAGKTPPDPRMIDALFKKFDKDGQGSLDFNEFVQFILSMPPPPEALREAFKEIDTDGSGSLSKDELKKLLAMAGQSNIPDEAMDEIMQAIGGGDGRVSFEEFCRFIAP